MVDILKEVKKNSGYTILNEHPKPYIVVSVITKGRGFMKIRRQGRAYWSGFRWRGVDGFKIGYAKVISWEVE
ncbi:hypothetical protein B6J31_23185 [Klebsiella pneumoniae]|nr:hypothetical protein B6J31_23185 [Klebsiella pneumoniae]